MKLKKHIIYSIFAFIICFASNAQKTTVSLSKVDTTGFYAISITPTIASYFENEMTDIRLLNEKNEQTPFAIRQKGISKNIYQFPGHRRTLFRAFLLRTRSCGINGY